MKKQKKVLRVTLSDGTQQVYDSVEAWRVDALERWELLACTNLKAVRREERRKKKAALSDGEALGERFNKLRKKEKKRKTA